MPVHHVMLAWTRMAKEAVINALVNQVKKMAGKQFPRKKFANSIFRTFQLYLLFSRLFFNRYM